MDITYELYFIVQCSCFALSWGALWWERVNKMLIIVILFDVAVFDTRKIEHVLRNVVAAVITCLWFYLAVWFGYCFTAFLAPAVAQAVSSLHPTAAACVLCQVPLRGVCGVQSFSGAGSFRVLRFPQLLHIHLIFYKLSLRDFTEANMSIKSVDSISVLWRPLGWLPQSLPRKSDEALFCNCSQTECIIYQTEVTRVCVIGDNVKFNYVVLIIFLNLRSNTWPNNSINL
jgi:hypothetical protein